MTRIRPIKQPFIYCTKKTGGGGGGPVTVAEVMRAIVGSSGHQRLLRIAAARRGPADQVEDVVQEALLAAWRKCPSELWTEEAAPRLYRWLAVVTRRLAMRWKRAQRRHPRQPLKNDDRELKDRRDEEAAILAQREEEYALLRAGLAELREKYPTNYRLLYGRFFDGRPVKELAKKEGLRDNTASSRIAWSIKWLRARVSNIGKEDAE